MEDLGFWRAAALESTRWHGCTVAGKLPIRAAVPTNVVLLCFSGDRWAPIDGLGAGRPGCGSSRVGGLGNGLAPTQAWQE